MTFKLFDYQQTIYDQLVKLFKKNQVVCAAGTTGMGKTELASQLILDNPNARFLVLAHGQSTLRTNFYERLTNKPELTDHTFELTASTLAPEAAKARIVVSLPQTVHRCIDRLGSFDYLIVDEAHQFYNQSEADSEESMYKTILENHKGKQLLLTASHYELKDIPKVFFSREEALAVGRVEDVTIDIFETETVISSGDYTLSGEVRESVRLNSAISYLKTYLTPEKLPAMVTVHSIETAKALVTQLVAEGYITTMSDSISDPKSDNIEAFKNGQYQICVVVNRAQIGFDFPGLISFVDASYSQSIPRIEQMVGRVARLHPDGKRTKYYAKLAPARQLGDVYLIVAGVIALGVKSIYRKWDGKPATLKVKLPGGLLNLKEMNGATPDPKKVKARLPQPTEGHKKENRPTPHVRLSFADYQGMHDAPTLTLAQGQEFCKKLRGDSPWLTATSPKEIADWLREEIKPANLIEWRTKHRPSHQRALNVGWYWEVQKQLGFEIPDDRYKTYDNVWGFMRWVKDTVKPSSMEDWRNRHIKSYRFAMKQKGWKVRMAEELDGIPLKIGA